METEAGSPGSESCALSCTSVSVAADRPHRCRDRVRCTLRRTQFVPGVYTRAADARSARSGHTLTPYGNTPRYSELEK
eukprot:scaffold5167_cov66-Phaeocystis_antarctica.AAC.3